MDIIMLGTGHATVRNCYNTCFVIKTETDTLLVDGGGGNEILRRLDYVHVPVGSLTAIFVTHAHTDHIFGIVWVLRMLCVHIFHHPDFHLTVYGNAKVVDVLRWMCRVTLSAKYFAAIDSNITFRVVADGERLRVGRDLDMQFFDMGSANEPQCGFRLALPDGKWLVCFGDEPYREIVRPYAHGAEWLMCEAYCLDSEEALHKAHLKHHSTVREAALRAQQLGVKNLILYHSEDSDLDSRAERYAAEARTVYDGNVVVPDDLDMIDVNDSQ